MHIELGTLERLPGEATPALMVDLEHVPLCLLAVPTENALEDVGDIGHQVDRVIPADDQKARFLRSTGLVLRVCRFVGNGGDGRGVCHTGSLGEGTGTDNRVLRPRPGVVEATTAAEGESRTAAEEADAPIGTRSEACCGVAAKTSVAVFGVISRDDRPGGTGGTIADGVGPRARETALSRNDFRKKTV